MFADGAGGKGGPSLGSTVMFDAAAGSQAVYALIEARAAYAPVSGKTTLYVESARD